MEFSEAIIDSVFGTGFKGQIKGLLADIIKAMNDSRAIKIAIDAPSGLNGNTGEVSNLSFVADYTVTLGAPKVGLFMFPGKKITGEIWIAEIGIPDCSFNSVEADSFLLTTQLVQTLLPPKDDQLHKGSAGKLFILAGSDQYQGAGVVASYGAHRSGVGIVNLGLPDCLEGNLCSQVLPETILSFVDSNKGVFDLKADFIENLNGKYRALLAGPGWGRSPIAEKSLETILHKWNGSLILDADALNQLKDKEALKNREYVPVITPHLGEMARLLEIPVEEVATRQIQVAREFARNYKTIVVLKSAVTVVSDHTGRVFVSSRPNPGLAKGGSGDLLSGLIAGLIASGLSELNAALAAVHIQAEAAEEAVTELGVDAVTISEIAAYVPRAFKKLREGEA
jgi:NAD(P)H-hydrate epimerase